MAIQQPDVDVLERCRKHIGTAHINETDAADEIERLRGRLDWWSTWMDKYYNTPLNNSVYHPERTDPTIIERIEAMEATVAKLPKTADGVAVVPGMKVYVSPGIISGSNQGPRESEPVLCGPLSGVCDDLLGEVDEYFWTFSASDCYSTREAADAAKEAT